LSGDREQQPVSVLPAASASTSRYMVWACSAAWGAAIGAILSAHETLNWLFPVSLVVLVLLIGRATHRLLRRLDELAPTLREEHRVDMYWVRGNLAHWRLLDASGDPRVSSDAAVTELRAQVQTYFAALWLFIGFFAAGLLTAAVIPVLKLN
jgi:hypothetical protein